MKRVLIVALTLIVLLLWSVSRCPKSSPAEVSNDFCHAGRWYTSETAR